MTTEEFLTARNKDIVTRLDEIATRVSELEDERCTLGREARALRKERSANMIRLGLPVRPRKPQEDKKDAKESESDGA